MSGEGLSIAKALGQEKLNIVLADIDKDNLLKASKELQQSGVPVLAVELDVSEESQRHDLARKAVERFDKIHMVVNNAGISVETDRLEKQESDGWLWTLNVNLMGGASFGGAYTATKMSVVGLSESWATEFKRDGISVSVLCPAFVQTRIHESNRNRPSNNPAETSISKDDVRQDNTRTLVENGMEVSNIGKQVVEALKLGEFYIFTHPNYREVIQARSKAIDQAFERAAKSPLLQHMVNQSIDRLSIAYFFVF